MKSICSTESTKIYDDSTTFRLIFPSFKKLLNYFCMFTELFLLTLEASSEVFFMIESEGSNEKMNND